MSAAGCRPTGILLQGTAVEIAPCALFGRTHRDVDVLEDLLGCNATGAVGGLDEIIADVALVFATERVDEEQGFGQLPSPDQKTGAINLPFGCSIPHIIQPWGREDVD